jgi:hypothetical protein
MLFGELSGIIKCEESHLHKDANTADKFARCDAAVRGHWIISRNKLQEGYLSLQKGNLLAKLLNVLKSLK